MRDTEGGREREREREKVIDREAENAYRITENEDWTKSRR